MDINDVIANQKFIAWFLFGIAIEIAVFGLGIYNCQQVEKGKSGA